MTQEIDSSCTPSDEASKRYVIARIHPIGLGAAIFFLVVGSILLLDTLNSEGWLNPAAFASENHRGLAVIMDIPFAGQAMTLGMVCFLALLLCQFILLAFQRFEDVVLEDGRLFYVSRPWLGKTPKAAVAAVRWVKPQQETMMNKGTKNIEVLHVSRTRSGKSLRTVVLRPWFYREGAKQIAANFEACGLGFKTEVGTHASPIWERQGVE